MSLRALLAKFAPLAAAKGLTLGMPDSLLFVRTDPALLESILDNLLANAVAYTARGSVTWPRGGRTRLGNRGS